MLLVEFFCKSMYFIPHLPSMEPIAKPLPSEKQDIAVVEYLSGEVSKPRGEKSPFIVNLKSQ